MSFPVSHVLLCGVIRAAQFPPNLYCGHLSPAPAQSSWSISPAVAALRGPFRVSGPLPSPPGSALAGHGARPAPDTPLRLLRVRLHRVVHRVIFTPQHVARTRWSTWLLPPHTQCLEWVLESELGLDFTNCAMLGKFS